MIALKYGPWNGKTIPASAEELRKPVVIKDHEYETIGFYEFNEADGCHHWRNQVGKGEAIVGRVF